MIMIEMLLMKNQTINGIMEKLEIIGMTMMEKTLMVMESETHHTIL